MKYGLSRARLNSDLFTELTKAEYDGIKKARDGLFEALFLEEKFDFLIENYLEFETEILTVAARHMVFSEGVPGWSHNERNLVSRRIVNLLTTCRLYVL